MAGVARPFFSTPPTGSHYITLLGGHTYNEDYIERVLVSSFGVHPKAAEYLAHKYGDLALQVLWYDKVRRVDDCGALDFLLSFLQQNFFFYATRAEQQGWMGDPRFENFPV